LASAVLERGIFVPPGDLDAFVSALLELAADTGLRLKFGQEARRYAVSHLNRDEILRRFERSILNAYNVSSRDAEPFAASGSEFPVEKTVTAAGNTGDD
jgi:colanic acid biosynthesis glycosyl transferase WcaI